MTTVLSLIVYDENAPDGQGEVTAIHLRPGLPTAGTMALALHLATVGQQMASAPPPPLLPPSYLDGPPPPANGAIGPGPADLLPAPPRGRGRGKQ
jgi:hypothetical protein